MKSIRTIEIPDKALVQLHLILRTYPLINECDSSDSVSDDEAARCGTMGSSSQRHQDIVPRRLESGQKLQIFIVAALKFLSPIISPLRV